MTKEKETMVENLPSKSRTYLMARVLPYVLIIDINPANRLERDRI